MGFRDRFKKMLGRGEPIRPAAEPPQKQKVRARAVYRTGSERRIEGAEHVLEETPTPPPEPDAEEPRAEQSQVEESLVEEPSATPLTYQVRLVNEDEDLDVTIEVAHGEYILEAAERQAVDLPSSCKAGGCYVCAGVVLEGEVDLSDEQVVLDEDHIEAGLTLLCCASPLSDLKIHTHKEDAVT